MPLSCTMEKIDVAMGAEQIGVPSSHRIVSFLELESSELIG